VEVWQGGTQLHKGLPIINGAVDATLGSRVARKLTLTVANDWYPVSTGDLLAPAGNELRAFRGVQYATGEVDEFPVFRGRMSGADLQDDGTVKVSADDRAAEVAEAGFVVPEASIPGSRNVDEIRRLIRSAVPDATWGPIAAKTQAVPALVWDDRSKACDDLTTAVNCLWYPLADGRFTIVEIPWTRKVKAVLTLADGPGGQIIKSTSARSRTDVYNVVTVTGGRTDGSPPVVATARDENPASATYWRGPFGVRTKTIKVQEALTQAQAKTMADTYLRRYIALNETWKLLIVPDGSIELGDPVELQALGRLPVRAVTNALVLSRLNAPRQASCETRQAGSRPVSGPYSARRRVLLARPSGSSA
jgi:hypothetical protein